MAHTFKMTGTSHNTWRRHWKHQRGSPAASNISDSLTITSVHPLQLRGNSCDLRPSFKPAEQDVKLSGHVTERAQAGQPQREDTAFPQTEGQQSQRVSALSNQVRLKAQSQSVVKQFNPAVPKLDAQAVPRSFTQQAQRCLDEPHAASRPVYGGINSSTCTSSVQSSGKSRTVQSQSSNKKTRRLGCVGFKVLSIQRLARPVLKQRWTKEDNVEESRESNVENNQDITPVSSKTSQSRHSPADCVADKSQPNSSQKAPLHTYPTRISIQNGRSLCLGKQDFPSIHEGKGEESGSVEKNTLRGLLDGEKNESRYEKTSFHSQYPDSHKGVCAKSIESGQHWVNPLGISHRRSHSRGTHDENVTLHNKVDDPTPFLKSIPTAQENAVDAEFYPTTPFIKKTLCRIPVDETGDSATANRQTKARAVKQATLEYRQKTTTQSPDRNKMVASLAQKGTDDSTPTKHHVSSSFMNTSQSENNVEKHPPKYFKRTEKSRSELVGQEVAPGTSSLPRSGKPPLQLSKSNITTDVAAENVSEAQINAFNGESADTAFAQKGPMDSKRVCINGIEIKAAAVAKHPEDPVLENPVEAISVSSCYEDIKTTPSDQMTSDNITDTGDAKSAETNVDCSNVCRTHPDNNVVSERTETTAEMHLNYTEAPQFPLHALETAGPSTVENVYIPSAYKGSTPPSPLSVLPHPTKTVRFQQILPDSRSLGDISTEPDSNNNSGVKTSHTKPLKINKVELEGVSTIRRYTNATANMRMENVSEDPGDKNPSFKCVAFASISESVPVKTNLDCGDVRNISENNDRCAGIHQADDDDDPLIPRPLQMRDVGAKRSAVTSAGSDDISDELKDSTRSPDNPQSKERNNSYELHMPERLEAKRDAQTGHTGLEATRNSQTEHTGLEAKRDSQTEHTGLEAKGDSHTEHTGLEAKRDSQTEHTGLEAKRDSHTEPTGLKAKGIAQTEHTGLEVKRDSHTEPTGLEAKGIAQTEHTGLEVKRDSHTEHTGLEAKGIAQTEHTGLEVKRDSHTEHTGLEAKGIAQTEHTGLEVKRDSHTEHTGLEVKGIAHTEHTGVEAKGIAQTEHIGLEAKRDSHTEHTGLEAKRDAQTEHTGLEATRDAHTEHTELKAKRDAQTEHTGLEIKRDAQTEHTGLETNRDAQTERTGLEPKGDAQTEHTGLESKGDAHTEHTGLKAKGDAQTEHTGLESKWDAHTEHTDTVTTSAQTPHASSDGDIPNDVKRSQTKETDIDEGPTDQNPPHSTLPTGDNVFSAAQSDSKLTDKDHKETNQSLDSALGRSHLDQNETNTSKPVSKSLPENETRCVQFKQRTPRIERKTASTNPIQPRPPDKPKTPQLLVSRKTDLIYSQKLSRTVRKGKSPAPTKLKEDPNQKTAPSWNRVRSAQPQVFRSVARVACMVNQRRSKSVMDMAGNKEPPVKCHCQRYLPGSGDNSCECEAQPGQSISDPDSKDPPRLDPAQLRWFSLLWEQSVSSKNLDRALNALRQMPYSQRHQLVQRVGGDAGGMLATCSLLGQAAMIEYLLDECGADIDRKGTYHDKLSPFPAIHEDVTPLWCAAVEGHVNSVTTLLRHGADIHARTANGSTAIRSACYRMQVDVVQVLLESGADVHSPNNSGVTCLMNGCTSPELCHLLLRHGSCPNDKDCTGNTALHYAASAGQLQSLRLLCQYGGNVMDRNDAGHSVLRCAALGGWTHVIDYLAEHSSSQMIEVIEAYELAGCTLVDLGDNGKFYEAGISAWTKALHLRHISSLPKTKLRMDKIAPFQYQLEFTTANQLERIVLDPDEAKLHSLLIKERLCGPGNEELIAAIVSRGTLSLDKGLYRLCIDLWMHALRLCLQSPRLLRRQLDHLPHKMVKLFLDLCEQRVEDTSGEQVVQVNDTLTMLGLLVEHLNKPFAQEHHIHANLPRHPHTPCTSHDSSTNSRDVGGHLFLVETALHVIRILATYQNLAESELQRFHTLVYHLVKADHRSSTGESLLHLCFPLCEIHEEEEGKRDAHRHPTLPFLETLITCGADVDALNHEGESPLFYALGSARGGRDIISCTEHVERENWVKLLLKHGAHVDRVSSSGRHVLSVVAQLGSVCVLSHVKLQCLAARALRVHRVPCRDPELLPLHLLSFVDYH